MLLGHRYHLMLFTRPVICALLGLKMDKQTVETPVVQLVGSMLQFFQTDLKVKCH
jgi:hypothetical protein